MKYPAIQNFINGQFVAGSSTRTMEVISPVDGTLLSTVPMSGTTDLDAAVKAAQAAFPGWSKTPIKERVQVFFRYKYLLEKHLKELAELCTEENGKTYGESVAEIEKSIELTEFATSLPQLVTGEVLEVSRSRLQELGIEYPSRIALNSLIPITTVTSGAGIAASSTVNTATQLTLEGLLNNNKSRFDVSPNPAVNFRKINGDVNLLSNPRIRVKNNEKAKILVGDKVPIITTTSTANVGISENVQYVDVGLKLDVEPRITLDDFVNIRIGLEVSSLGERTTTRNGATVFTIGTRNANTVLRLKNGETQVLAGLILDDERKNASKVPGLGDIPILGRLFANQEDRKSKTEIVLAITPRIIVNISQPKAELSEYWSGTESLITDKPQLNLPTSGGDSPESKMREQMRLRQLEINNQEIQQSQQPAVNDQTDTITQPPPTQPFENPGAQQPPVQPPALPDISQNPDGSAFLPNQQPSPAPQAPIPTN